MRVWRPDDHGHPPSREIDPSRVPARPDDDGGGDPTARAAAALWRVSCASCHGQAGEGGGPGLPPNARVPDMTTPEWQASRTDEQIAEVIRQGRGMMPGFADRVNPRGIEALVSHIRVAGRGE